MRFKVWQGIYSFVDFVYQWARGLASRRNYARVQVKIHLPRTKNLCHHVIEDALLTCGGVFHKSGLQWCGYAFNKSVNHVWVDDGKFIAFSSDAVEYDGFVDFVEHCVVDMKSGEKLYVRA